MKPPLNYMMLHEDTLADEFDAILNYRVSHAGIVLAGGYTEAEVFAGAGITAGVTPGVTRRLDATLAGAYSTDYGHRTNNGLGDGSAPMVDKSNFKRFEVTSAATFTGATGFTVTGAGTVGSPYLVENCLIYSMDVLAPETDGPHFTWNDPAATYHIKFKNCTFLQPRATFNMFEITNSGTGTLTLEDCQLGGILNLTGSNAMVKVLAGTVNVTRSFITLCIGNSFWAAGSTAVISVTHSKFDTTGGPWPGSFGAPALFRNTVAGGTITCTDTTMDHKNAAPLLEAAANCTATFTRVLFNSSDSTAIGVIIPTPTATVLEAWTSGLTMTDCRFYSGNLSTMLGENTVNDNQTVRNWEVVHCDFIVSGTRLSGSVMISLGDGNAVATGTCDEVNFRWCRFSRPQATGIVAGNEVLFLAKASNCTIECCWVDKCGEDAYEYSQPFSNCSVIYCGGGEVSGSYVGGNMVDFYGAYAATQASAAWGSVGGNTGGHQAHHIWGECRGDAVIVDCVHGVTVHTIDVVNDLGTPFVQVPPVAGIRLMSRSSSGISSLDGVTVSAPLTAAGDSFNGWPCKLAHAVAATNGSTTVSGTELSGQTVITLASSTGFTANDMVRIVLADGTKHYTTQVGAPAGADITIASALPQNSALNAGVQRFTPYTAGTVTWSDGLGATKGGTDGIVDGI